MDPVPVIDQPVMLLLGLGHARAPRFGDHPEGVFRLQTGVQKDPGSGKAGPANAAAAVHGRIDPLCDVAAEIRGEGRETLERSGQAEVGNWKGGETHLVCLAKRSFLAEAESLRFRFLEKRRDLHDPGRRDFGEGRSRVIAGRRLCHDAQKSLPDFRDPVDPGSHTSALSWERQ
ncbi:MAG: hypothetical protein QNJ67_00865 [Kiloniellales bacterium]|nr:hypothetical protein [Kiloniellales bacterium]